MSLPIPLYGLEIPPMLVQSARIHNSLVKRALRTLIEWHWRKRIPRHFETAAARRYGYKRRNPLYIRAKVRRYGSGVDLVKSGRTRDVMTTQAQITVGGSATGGAGKGPTATLRLRFPFPGGTGKFRGQSHQAVTIEQMQREIQEIVADEIAEINQQLKDAYEVLLDVELASGRRIRLAV